MVPGCQGQPCVRDLLAPGPRGRGLMPVRYWVCLASGGAIVLAKANRVRLGACEQRACTTIVLLGYVQRTQKLLVLMRFQLQLTCRLSAGRTWKARRS